MPIAIGFKILYGPEAEEETPEVIEQVPEVSTIEDKVVVVTEVPGIAPENIRMGMTGVPSRSSPRRTAGGITRRRCRRATRARSRRGSSTGSSRSYSRREAEAAVQAETGTTTPLIFEGRIRDGMVRPVTKIGICVRRLLLVVGFRAGPATARRRR